MYKRQVLALLKKNGKKTVFVNFSGSAMAIVPETQNCDAILQAWYPGVPVQHFAHGAPAALGHAPAVFVHGGQKPPILAVRGGSAAVSYTHLDVYKRQV